VARFDCATRPFAEIGLDLLFATSATDYLRRATAGALLAALSGCGEMLELPV
jgi:hypothetical protein